MRTERGFTLMEMLVALIIGAIIVSQLYILTRAMGHDTTKQQMETEAMQRARIGIELLTADFQRAGMNASPNPMRDPDSMVTKGEGSYSAISQHAYKRPAVIHLNHSGSENTDSIVLVGSFVSSNTYQAYVDASGPNASVSIVQPFATAEDCFTEFNPAYAFLHLFAPNGQTADARIATVACEAPDDTTSGDTDTDTDADTDGDADTDSDACGCALTLESGELFADGPSAFASGQLVHVAANQASLYTVKEVGDHRALVRYFVDFDAITNENFEDCTADGILGISGTDTDADTDSDTDADADSDGDVLSAPIEASMKIIADYVTDFQVWFRNVYQGEGDSWAAPRYYGVDGDTRILPPDNVNLFHSDPTFAEDEEGTHLSCDLTTAAYLGPEQIRSAVIRLGVRTEKTDQEVMKVPADQCETYWTGLEAEEDNFFLFYNVEPPPMNGEGACTDVGAYKVRTVVTEVAMPNIAARMASFKDMVNLDE